jgi:hypothetical protein
MTKFPGPESTVPLDWQKATGCTNVLTGKEKRTTTAIGDSHFEAVYPLHMEVEFRHSTRKEKKRGLVMMVLNRR